MLSKISLHHGWTIISLWQGCFTQSVSSLLRNNDQSYFKLLLKTLKTLKLLALTTA